MKTQSCAKQQYILIILLLACLQWSCSDTPSDGSDKPRPAVLPDISFSQSSESIDAYEFVEATINVKRPTAQNPFREVRVTGSFEQTNLSRSLVVDGFCDSADGSVFRIRFMPTKPGDYVYSVTYWQDNLQKVHKGKFKAVIAKHRGIVQVDSTFPWHFIWKGTGEHYFLNGTTAFLLMGWDDEKVIRDNLSRLHAFDVNRIRVLLNGRSDHFWTEPIKADRGFRAHLNPWIARRPDDIANPGFDFTRFNVPYWQKFERMLKFARENDLVISVILDWNDTSVHPDASYWQKFELMLESAKLGWNDTSINPANAPYWRKFKWMLKSVVLKWDDTSLRPVAGSEDERRYLRYTVARLAAYSNVTWDLGDDLDSFRDVVWTHDTGTLLHEIDAYHHLASSHPTDADGPQDRSSPWFGMTSFQQWKRPLHAWMLEQRRLQTATGRIIPQVNEEYGYEDHYPEWAPYKAPAASADANRRAAWEIAMAGSYQTTGETAKRGTGMYPDKGGGWVNGRGDDTMMMLKGYAHMVHFFTGFEWWKVEPHDELVNNGSFCLAEPGRLYAIYMPHGGSVTARLEPGRYEVKWFNPRNGMYTDAPVAEGPVWTSPSATDGSDWVILMKSL